MTESRPLIQVRDVSKVFHTRDGEIVALERMSLDIHPGEILSLVGATRLVTVSFASP